MWLLRVFVVEASRRKKQHILFAGFTVMRLCKINNCNIVLVHHDFSYMIRQESNLYSYSRYRGISIKLRFESSLQNKRTRKYTPNNSNNYVELPNSESCMVYICIVCISVFLFITLMLKQAKIGRILIKCNQFIAVLK